METTLIILSGNLEEIEKILNEKHVELLKLIFGGHSARFNIADPKSSSKENNKVLRVVIAFSIKNPKYGLRKYKLNIKLSKNYLVFSIQLDEQLRAILKDDLDLVKVFLEIGLQVESKKIADHPLKNGTNGQQHTKPKKTKNRRKKPKNKTLSKSQRKERRRQLRKK